MATTASRVAHVSYTQMVLMVAVVLISLGSLTDCLMCYQCSGETLDSLCIKDTEILANVSTRSTYVKNCTGIHNWTRCSIFYGSAKDGLVFYERTCHDGFTFPVGLLSKQFLDLPPNNDTTCDVFDQKTVVCYQPCDTDFCNGPEPFLENNCTDPDNEECSACGIFIINELMFLETVGVLISFMVTRGILSLMPY